jgi:hypothetical protein
LIETSQQNEVSLEKWVFPIHVTLLLHPLAMSNMVWLLLPDDSELRAAAAALPRC